jgi:hypothetical protein
MTMHLVPVALVPLLICCSASSGQADASKDCDRRNRWGYVGADGRGYIHLALPLPISRLDLERWSWFAGLSDAQAHAVGHFWDRYRAAECELHFQFVQPLWEAGAEIASEGSPSQSLILAHALHALFVNDHPDAVRRLRTLEEQFFAEWVPILAESQLPLLDSIRRQRQRDRHNPRPLGGYPGSEFDLAKSVYQLLAHDIDLRRESPDRFLELALDYDQAITPLFRSRAEAVLKAMAEGTLERAQLASYGAFEYGSETWREAIVVRERIRDYARHRLQIEKRIHDRNLHFLRRLGEFAPRGAVELLTAEFRGTAYPVVYPDPTDTRGVFAAALEDSGLDETERGAIRELGEAHERARQKICDQMVRHYLEWREVSAIESGRPPGPRANYEQAIATEWDARNQRALAAVTALEEILGEERIAPLTKELERFRTRVDNATLRLDPRFDRPM